MNPVAKALWYIESHYGQDIALDDIADCAGVSRFHLLRAFGAATGLSIMRYVRARRLAEAARRLVGSADDILPVALDAGYGSHEAFTRAFRDHFGVTPESVRRLRSVDHLCLQEQISMSSLTSAKLNPPRLIDSKPLLIAGLAEHYDCERSGAGIPGQWQKFNAYIDSVPGRIGRVAYGVCYNTDDAGNMDYLAGVEVKEFSGLPPHFSHLRIPQQRYAVFLHEDHVSAIRGTWNSIWNDWLPHSNHAVADAPFFELYGESFDPRSGNGGVELWVPIA